MNPLERRIEELERQVKALNNASTIPFTIEKALGTRLGTINIRKMVYDYDGDAVDNNVSINEGGAATKTALGPPDSWIFITIPAEDQDIVTLGIPVYNQ